MALTRITTTALASATSANGTARNGAAFVNNFSAPGALSVYCTASITTSSVLATFKLQLSEDGTTYYDVSGGTSSNVTFSTAAGTGSAVTTSKILMLDIAGQSWQYARVVATLSGATTDPAEVAAAVAGYAARYQQPKERDNRVAIIITVDRILCGKLLKS